VVGIGYEEETQECGCTVIQDGSLGSSSRELENLDHPHSTMQLQSKRQQTATCIHIRAYCPNHITIYGVSFTAPMESFNLRICENMRSYKLTVTGIQACGSYFPRVGTPTALNSPGIISNFRTVTTFPISTHKNVSCPYIISQVPLPMVR
jgi:hypothetical protein